MFTGLVESKGTLLRRSGGAGNTRDARLVVEGDFGLTATPSIGHEPLVLGESIAVDGVCLTVASIVTPGGPGVPSVFEADASAETLAKTTLGDLSTGAAVNLERAVPLGGRMGGHIVSGHVDGVGLIKSKSPDGAAVKVTFQPPAELMRYIAPKGSICVNGVSLTVNGVSSDGFDVMIIPHTREKTSLDVLPVGSKVNLEVDLLARYVARMLQATGPGGGNDHAASDAAWLDRLKRAGYM